LEKIMVRTVSLLAFAFAGPLLIVSPAGAQTAYGAAVTAPSLQIPQPLNSQMPTLGQNPLNSALANVRAAPIAATVTAVALPASADK
jgi:hypothetical protein